MNSSGTPGDSSGPVQPFPYNLELLANLIYLARRSETVQQKRYLEWAENLIKEMRRNPRLWE
jgi:rhamnogalacturonyl hydrolase YesR